MKDKLIISCLTILHLACSNQEKPNQLKRVDFIQAVSKDYKQRLDLREGEYLTFKFLNQFYYSDSDTFDNSRSLFITIPVTDTAFTFKNDSTHLFQHLISDCRGLCPDIKIEEIKSAEITGKMIGKDKWRITVKTKYFDFERVILFVFKNLEVETIRL